MCFPGFQKYGFQNGFFGLKLLSLEQIFTEICVSGATNFIKIGKKIGLEMQDFFKKMKVGLLELEKGLKRWISRAKMCPETGGFEGSTSLYQLPM